MIQMISSDRPLQLLLIEDSKGDALFIEKTLKNTMLGAIDICCADSLASALKILADQEFDVAILDRSLPDVEGFSGLYSIQNFVPKLPVIFLTAYQDEQTAFQAIEQGAQDYLLKNKLDGHSIKRAIQYAILRKQFEGILIMRANYDMLTGLANRMLFESRFEMALARMRRHGGNLAVLFIDLDRFKLVNDVLGHAAGDQLLKEVGSRLRSILRPYDTAARLGGDEFAVLLENIPEINHGEIVAQKIIRVLEQPIQISDETVDIGVSIGISSCSAGDAVTSTLMIEQADAAMYEAKTQEGSCFRVYIPGSSGIARIA